MIFHEIDGQKLGVVRTADFMSFIVDHIFFRFMDAGRAGAAEAVADMVDCLIQMFEERGSLTPGQIDSAEYYLIKRDAMKLVFDGLVLEGTTGIMSAAFKMYNYVGQLPTKPAKLKK